MAVRWGCGRPLVAPLRDRPSLVGWWMGLGCVPTWVRPNVWLVMAFFLCCLGPSERVIDFFYCFICFGPTLVYFCTCPLQINNSPKLIEFVSYKSYLLSLVLNWMVLYKSWRLKIGVKDRQQYPTVQLSFYIYNYFMSSSNPMLLFITWSDDQGWRPRLAGRPRATRRCPCPHGSLPGESFDGSLASLLRN